MNHQREKDDVLISSFHHKKILSRGRNWITASLVFVLACLPVWIAISKSATTPFDEAAHFDYVWKVSNFEVPKVNEQYSQETLSMVACDMPGSTAWTPIGVCGSDEYDVNAAPFFGQSSATGYSPVYYVATGILFRGVSLVTSLVGFNWSDLRSMRVANSLWSGTAALLIFFACRRLNLPRILAIASGLVFVSAPATILQFATVNSDAGSQVAVALVFSMAVFYSTRRSNVENRRLEIFKAVCLLSVVGIVCSTKETTLLALPGVFYFAFNQKALTSHPPRDAPTFFREILRNRYAIGSLVIVTGFVGIFRAIQPILRGSGGPDFMGDLFPTLASINNVEVVFRRAPLFALESFANIAWADIHDMAGEFSTKLIGLLPFIFIVYCSSKITFAGRDTNESKPEEGLNSKYEIAARAYLINLFSLVIGAIMLTGLSVVLTGVAITQPRYFMAAASMLIVLGIVSAAEKSSKFLAITSLSVWVLSLTAVVF
jgi:hypothetical protein